MAKHAGISALASLLIFVLAGCGTGFKDVSSKACYADAVEYVNSEDLMNGTSKKEFSPEAPMTRAMLVTVLYRKAESP